MSRTADDVLDSIQRLTNLVVSHITDHTGALDTNAKIRSMELYVGSVELLLEHRPPRPARRGRRWLKRSRG